MRVRVMLAGLGLILGSAGVWSAEPSSAGSKVLRSGTIEGGTGVRTSGGQPFENPAVQRSGCEYSADCLAWLVSFCQPALAGVDPAVTASIVDVGALADGRTRRTLQTTAPTIPPWGLWPAAVIQFWGAGCTEIPGAKQHMYGSSSRCEWYPHPHMRCTALQIPTGAKWMTLSGYATTVHMSWTLT